MFGGRSTPSNDPPKVKRGGFALQRYLSKAQSIHGLIPAYISELISVRGTAGRHHLRSNNGLRLNGSTCKSLAMLGDRSFHVAAPEL